MPHHVRQALVACALALMLNATVHGAASPDESKGLLPVPNYSGDLWSRSYLAGDWGGTRTDWANKGFQFEVDWTQYFQSVVDGGAQSSSDYGGHLDYLVHLDLMRMGVLPGALVTLRAESRYGTSVNGAVGTILPTNTTAFFPLTDQLDDGVPIALTEVAYTQFLSEKLAVFGGKMDTLDGDPNEFASGRGKSQFMNANFIFNGALALRLPYSTLAAGVSWMPTKNFTFKSILCNTIDSSQTTGFTDFGDGNTWINEADLQYRLGALPGGTNLGVLWSFDQDFAQLNGELIFQPGEGPSVPNKNNTWAIYWSGWQYLYVKDPSDALIDTLNGVPDHEGFGLFARLGFADQDTNPIEVAASIGLGGKGMIPSRDHDTFGVGYYYSSIQDTRFGNAANVSDRAQGCEAFYNIELTPAAHLTFDLQATESPLPNIDTALILGARLNLKF